MDAMRELPGAEVIYWQYGVAAHGAARNADDRLQAFLSERAPGFSSGVFLSGLGSRTLQSSKDGWAMAELVRANESLYELVIATPASRLLDALRDHPDSAQVLAAIDDYLEVYGHQVYGLDFVEPTLAESPEMLLAQLKSMTANENDNPEVLEAAATRKREQALEDIRQALGDLEYWQFRCLLWFASRYYPVREEAMFYLSTPWTVFRPIAAELGRRLKEIGSIDDVDDIYFMRLVDVKVAMSMLGQREDLPKFPAANAGGPARQRELREARKRLRPPNMLPKEAHQIRDARLNPTFKPNDGSEDSLSGFAVSSGTVTGRVSLINSPDEFNRMQQGTILVCHTTSPAWTPLFTHAIGLVTDIGSIGAHGALVAREYGIPAVLGVGDGTERIEHGQVITVDGDAGTVYLKETQ